MVFYKFLLLALMAFVISFAIIFTINNENVAKIRLLEPPFSVSDSSLKVEPQRALFEATIENLGSTPIVVRGFGFLNKDGTPSEGCIFVYGVEIIVPARESFNVQIECINSPENLDFYIINLPQDASEPQLSGESGVSLPNLPDLNTWINSYLNPSNSNPTGSFLNSGEYPSSSSGAGVTPLPPPIGTTPPGSGGVGSQGSGGSSGSYFPDLDPPIFLGVNALNDVTPTISFFTEGSQCRMDNQDNSFFSMTTLNQCFVDTNSGEGHCTLNNNFALSNGPNNLYISCSSSDAYNNNLNNLDIPLNIDVQPPIISDISPSEGTYSSGISGVVVNGEVSGASSCSAGVYDTPYAHLNPYSSLPIQLDNSQLLFTAPLQLGNNYLVIICLDNLFNVARFDSGNYLVEPPVVSPTVSTAIPYLPVPSSSSGGGGGGSGGGSGDTSSFDGGKVDPDPVIDLPVIGGPDIDGDVIKNIDSSQINFMNFLINWFKGIFS